MLESYVNIAKGISALFSPYAEVVIHDLKKAKISHIAGSYSKRKVGDPSLLEGFEVDARKDVIGPYEKINFDGRKLKSMSIVLRSQEGEATHLLCVNFDVSVLVDINATINAFIGMKEQDHSAKVLFKEDWQEKINIFVHEHLKKSGRTIASASKDDKKKIVIALEKNGAFRAKNSTSYAAQVLKISRASLYNYLSQEG